MIAPIVAAVLADGEQLVRVIVPKPLTVQTIHLFLDRLGNLTHRRIYYLPFSRSLGVTRETAASLKSGMHARTWPPTRARSVAETSDHGEATASNGRRLPAGI